MEEMRKYKVDVGKEKSEAGESKQRWKEVWMEKKKERQKQEWDDGIRREGKDKGAR